MVAGEGVNAIVGRATTNVPVADHVVMLVAHAYHPDP
jgi:hypothetical protein